MSRTLHKRPVEDLVPLAKSHTRYWDRKDYMHFKVLHVQHKAKQQRKQDLEEE